MDAQEQNLCLLNMPVLVMEKILSNIQNTSSVSRTCRHLYDIVCGMEKTRRVMYIGAIDSNSRLNIDNDALFDSIMNSHRTIEAIELRLSNRSSSYELNKRQSEQITAIMKKFGANVTSLKLHGFVVPISLIFDLLQRAPKLESLSFIFGKVVGSLPENATISLQFPSLKTLFIIKFPGLLDIVNLIPAGPLSYYSTFIPQSAESTEVFTTILSKQHNIKSLALGVFPDSDVTALRVNHLQLDTLTFLPHVFENDFLEILKCQTNLKELSFVNTVELSGTLFHWICKNLKKLEIFEVQRLKRIEGNAVGMLGELKQLRRLRVNDAPNLFHNGFQFKSDSIEKFDIDTHPEFSCGKRLNKMVNSMVHNLPNLTHLKMKFKNFSAFSFVLRHCPKIVHLCSSISIPIPDQLTQQRFPNMQTLELCNFNRPLGTHNETMGQCMTSIIHAMPNLKSMSLSGKDGIRFDVDTMKEFVNESKSLDYFYVDQFELNRALPANDVVEIIRCLTGQLKGYRIDFSPSTSPEGLNFHQIKDTLSNEFYVRDNCRDEWAAQKSGENLSLFYCVKV